MTKRNDAVLALSRSQRIIRRRKAVLLIVASVGWLACAWMISTFSSNDGLARAGNSQPARQTRAQTPFSNLFATSKSNSASSLFSAVQATGLVAAYGFNEGVGTSLADASGNGHLGTISGAAWTTQGKYGNALTFDGINDWVTVNSTAMLNITSGITLEAWVFPTGTSGVRDILIKEGNSVDVYNLYGRNGAGLPESNVLIGGSNRTAQGTALAANVWTHVAGTYDGTALRLFINGVQVASTAISGSIGTASGPLRIGGNSIWGEFFLGRIDEIRIYNRALNQSEIQSDMNTPVGGVLSDTTPPVRSNGAPTGTLVAGTTQTTLSLTTDENATCRYSVVAGTGYASMPNTFTSTGSTAHSTTVSGLTNGTSYSFYVRCQDVAGNPNINDFTISFSIGQPGDTTPPVPSNGAPTGTLPVGTTQATLSLSTNETATCRYATTAGVGYGSMPNTFTTTGGNAHSTSVTGLANGGSYTYYVRCQDVAGNANPNDFTISFSVAVPSGGGLVAAYALNEGAGTSVTDATGNGHTGLISGASWSTQGKYGNALSFDGVNDWTTVNSSTMLSLTTGMTLEAWVFPTGTTGIRDILIKEGTNSDIYNLYSRNAGGLPESNVLVGGVNRTAQGTALAADVWTHVAGTYDGAALRLFINGNQVASTAVSGSIASSSSPLRIGGNSIWGEFFLGRIDEVRVYNRALSGTEIQADMVTPIDGAPGSPNVVITAPADGTAVAGTVEVSAAASDDTGVLGVQFLLDGGNLGAEDTTAPYSTQWDTTTATGGPHTLSARARDGQGNSSTSAPVSVAVTNNPLPGNFLDEVVVGVGLTFPTAFEFLPDGRMLITEFRGRVLVVQPGANVPDETPVIDLPNIFLEDVTAGGERGLVNIVADPAFATNGFIYVFYTAATPQRDRVSRLTMTGNTASPASEFVVWQGFADSSSTDHHGGGLAFGPDGKLYISTGDNGDPPSSQPLTSDHGKILRLNKDGSVPTDNPFFDGTGSNIDSIWIRGLRNPYRFSFDSANGRMYIGDVGLNTTEEVNIGVAGANYGWPICEGSCGISGMTNPLFSYPHGGRDSAVTGGFVYRGNQFPAAYQGAYFYGDFAQNWIRYLSLDASGNVTGNTPFLPPDGTPDGPFDPIMLKPGADGSLYYVDFGWGWQETVNPAAIRRIRFVSGNQPPVAVASASPQSGQAPLTVNFSSAGSSDPEGQPLTYLWNFGDGETSTAPNPVHVYQQSGLYAAQLSVSDGTSTTHSDVVSIAAGNAPLGSITSPTNGLIFRAGDVITFAGTATDLEDNPVPPSAYSWTILFHHDSHVHPTLGPLSGVTSGSFTIPVSGHDFAGNTRYEIILTITDSSGLQHTSSVFVFPHKVNLTFVTEPAGLNINIGGISSVTPFVLDTLTGFQYTIEAPNQSQGGVAYSFSSWSDGGLQSHGIVAGEVGATYTATYQGIASQTAFPNATTILTGTLSSGSAASLVSDNNVYFAVNSTTTGTRTAAWYGAFTGISNSLSNLRVNYKGNNSRNSTQTIAIWNWTTSTWLQLDSRTVGTTEVAINNLIPPGTLADYVSGSVGNGELRVRIQAQATANLINRGDLMSMTCDVPVGPPPPDTTPPARSNGVPTGALPAGTTQTILSLSTDESATCRYSTTAGVAYGSMPNTFSTTGGTAHSTTVTGLTNGSSYNFFVRCQDLAGNANSNDFAISFSVAVPPSGGLIAAYGFNEGTGSSAADASGNNHTGSISGATWSTLGKFGNALSFDGVNDWVTVNHTAMLNLTTGMTIEAWVFPTSSIGVRDIVIKESSNTDIYNLYGRNGAGLPESNVFVGGSNRTAQGTALAVNTWTHLAGTYDGSTLRLFIDGTQVAGTAITGSIATSTGPLRIGGNSIWGEFFLGRIDELRIYNRALTAGEIQSDMATPIN